VRFEFAYERAVLAFGAQSAIDLPQCRLAAIMAQDTTAEDPIEIQPVTSRTSPASSVMTWWKSRPWLCNALMMSTRLRSAMSGSQVCSNTCTR